MADEFKLIEQAIGPVIEIEEKVSVWRMPSIFGRDYQRINDYLVSQGAECAGMPYARYLEMNWELELSRGKLAMFFALLTRQWHFFAGMPSSKTLPGEGELKSRLMESQRYATAIHRGPYQKCGVTYRALFDWAKSQGLSLKNEAIECYVNDPQKVAKADIETVILIPLSD